MKIPKARVCSSWRWVGTTERDSELHPAKIRKKKERVLDLPIPLKHGEKGVELNGQDYREVSVRALSGQVQLQNKVFQKGSI